MKVKVYISQESFRRKQFESCGVYFSRVTKKEAVWKLRSMSLKSHLQGSSVKVALNISQESFTREQCESCAVYISRVIYKGAV